MMGSHQHLAQVGVQLWLLPALAVIIFGLWTRSWLERRCLIKLARALGLEFRPGHDRKVAERFAGFTALHVGHCTRTIDVMSGPTDWGTLTAFRIISELGSRTKRRLVHVFAVVIEVSTGIDLLKLGRHPGVLQDNCGRPTVCHKRQEPDVFLIAGRRDEDSLPVEALLDWAAGQPEDWVWEVTSDRVAGYARYAGKLDDIRALVNAAQDLAARLQASRSATTE